MPVGQDPSPLFQQFARPEKLVSSDWVAEHLDDPSVVIVESDETSSCTRPDTCPAP